VDVVEAAGCLDRAVRQLRYDSRRVSAGDLFVAVKGKRCDGHAFLSQAYERGAQAAVGQGPFDPPAGFGYVRVADSQRALSQLAAACYGHPFQRLFTVGVTGGDLGVAPGNVQDNSDAVYQIDGDPVLSPDETALNAAVLRVAQDPQGRHPDGLANIPAIAGRLPIPVVSLHTIGDLFVPFSMEQIYARRAGAQGAADLLVTRAIRDHNHCGFAVQEEEAAFAALDNWVTNGVKPAGDDILTPASVADPEFGCQFSVPGHANYPACAP